MSSNTFLNIFSNRVLDRAAEESSCLGNKSVSIEHLFLGLISETDSTAVAVLRNLDLNLATLRKEITCQVFNRIPFIENYSEGSHGTLSTQAKDALRLARQEANSLGFDTVGTEHLLLAILHEKDGIPSAVLQSQGVGFDQVMTEVARMVGRTPPLAGAGEDRPTAEQLFSSPKIGLYRFNRKAHSVVLQALSGLVLGEREQVPARTLLLSLLREPSSAVVTILKTAEIDRREIIWEVDNRGDSDEDDSRRGPWLLSPGGMRVLQYASEEAERLGYSYIGTEHLLLGFLREGGPIVEPLARRGFTVEKAQAEIADLMHTFL